MSHKNGEKKTARKCACVKSIRFKNAEILESSFVKVDSRIDVWIATLVSLARDDRKRASLARDDRENADSSLNLLAVDLLKKLRLRLVLCFQCCFGILGL